MIPIKNLYYMLSYAFQLLNEQGYKNLATEEFKNAGDLCAAILIRGISYQLKRGLGREYISETDTISAIRGKIEITEISASEKLEGFRREQDKFIEPSFSTIAAYKEHAAIIHYSASEESNYKLEAKNLFLVDSGGQYLDGTTDITRTFALGPITDIERRDFTNTVTATPSFIWLFLILFNSTSFFIALNITVGLSFSIFCIFILKK